MTENKPGDESLRQEFETLGMNLIDALRSAWQAPESRRLRDEVTTGLNDLSSTLKREAENIANSPAAQKVQTSMEDVGEKIRSPEIQEKVRRELIDALQTMNTELQRVIERWSPPSSPGQEEEIVPPPIDAEPGETTDTSAS